IPFVHPLHEPLRDGCKIEVHGEVEEGHHENFAIELLSGPHIVLHVNFRFLPGEHVLVLNAAAHGNWGEEVRTTNTLHPGQHFNISVIVHHDHYDIEVNGETVGEFRHRYPIHTVQALGVKGDVHVHKIEFHGFHFERRKLQPLGKAIMIMAMEVILDMAHPTMLHR
ncbi:unnamed protein product, partial [Enterobius vermicularis]|uniref:Galectin n=1 Tax=Enterobius vermicularis TaxID=51028 RepID=A0A0N4UUY7_ENTVE